MFNFRNVYLYFLALKLVSINFLKEIYFNSNFYLNSLKTKVPDNFYFYPNPFLLSSFVKNKNFAFKITRTDINIFWDVHKNPKEVENLNSFYWLNLINRKDDNLIIQKIILLWINKNKKYKKNIWKNSNTSKRIISWILNADIILNNTEKEFKNIFYESIIIQVNHLKKQIKDEKSQVIKIEIISAIILSGLVFNEYENNFKLGISELKKIVEDFFDKDGFPASRNIYDLVQCSKFLILIKECCKDAQEYIPDYLEDIVEKIIICVNSIRTPNYQVPLFNGTNEFKINDYYKYISGLDYKLTNTKHNVGQIYNFNNKKINFFFDAGSPPKKNYSSSYQSGPLSFEYYNEEDKIITNCGYGNQISRKIEQVSRLTSAQSTLILNDTSVTKFEKNKLIHSVYGSAIKNSFSVFDCEFENETNHFSISAKHNAYEDNFGYIHNRLIKINKGDGSLMGQDILSSVKNTEVDNYYSIRFHLYPGITAVQTMGGKTILIQINKKKSLIFNSNGDSLSLEKSIFLGRNKIINNFCINISGSIIKNKNKKIDWEFKKNS